MGHRGVNTPDYYRRVNLRNSRAKLEGLLRANFQEGAQLVTLTYGPGCLTPSYKLAEMQLLAWIRSARDKQGKRLHYIRATERDGTGDGYPVHRVVMALSGASAASLAALWEYGPATVEAVQGDQLDALAGLLMAQALEAGRTAVPCCRMWSPSEGLNRPGKER